MAEWLLRLLEPCRNSELNPCRPTHWDMPYPQSKGFVCIYRENRYMNRHISQTWIEFLHAGLHFRIAKSNIEVGQEFLAANPLRTWNSGQILQNGLWMVAQWYKYHYYYSRWFFQHQIAKKSSYRKSKLAAFKHSFLCATVLIANFGCNHARDRLQAFTRRHLKWLCCSIESEQTPFSRTGSQFRSAALRRSPQDSMRNMRICLEIVSSIW